MPFALQKHTKAARAILDASVACENIDSPNTARANVHAIQPAHQLAIHPGLHAVRKTRFVQRNVGIHHLRNYPRAALTVARRG